VHAQTDAVVEIGNKAIAIGRGDAPTIDGRLDEAAWQSATVVEDLHQIIPLEYAEPTEPTEIRIYYDDDALYVGARMHDSSPESMNATVLRQGASFFGDDFFSVILSPFNDNRNGYRFQINPNGIRMEMLFFDTSNQDWNWNGIWQGKAVRDASGWTAEIALPFKTLSFDPNNDTWGINFTRDLGRLDERAGWVSRNSSQDPSIAGEVTGFEDLDVGLGLDVVPSVALIQRHDFDPSRSESSFEPSLDLFYRLTPSVNAALTLNTDFSATEVDDRQVELTRFSLFFPEKRTFFLRDADIFRFGRVGERLGFGLTGSSTLARPDLENGRPYFSRRIGLSADGQPVDLDAGAKLAGRVGPWTLGALAIRQEAFGDIDATDIFVGRMTANVLQESSVGVIVTDGDPRSNLDNSVVGVDFIYNNTRLAGGRALNGELWYQESDTEGVVDEQAAYGFRLRSPNNIGWRGGFGAKQIEENFFPALGFVNRAGVLDQTYELGYSRRIAGDFVRTIYSAVDAERIEYIDGGLQTQVVTFRAFEFESNARDRGHLRAYATKEVLLEPFVIWEKDTEQVVIAPGEYSFNETELSFSSGQARPVWGTLTYQAGDFYDGERSRIVAGFGWRPSIHYQMALDYAINDVTLPAGDFITRLVQFRSDVVFSSTTSWSTLIQYDNVTETMGINTRFHWIPEAGREVFVVLNHNLQDLDLDNRFQSRRADLAIKLNYTLRY